MAKRDNHGRTELHWAAEGGDAKRIRELKLANIDEEDSPGHYANSMDHMLETALHIAARHGHDDAVLALIEEQPQWNIIPLIRNGSKETAREVGKDKLKPETLAALERAEQRKYPTAPRTPITLLHVARTKIKFPELLQELSQASPSAIFAAEDKKLPFIITLNFQTVDEAKAFLGNIVKHVSDKELRASRSLQAVQYAPQTIRADNLAQLLACPETRELRDNSEIAVVQSSGRA